MKLGKLAVEVQMQKEKACALGRVGARLQLCLDKLGALGQRWSGGDRTVHAEHQALRRQAEELRFYLVVQREALGVTRHEDLDLAYPLPPRLPRP